MIKFLFYHLFYVPKKIKGHYNLAEYRYSNTDNPHAQKIFLFCGKNCSLEEFIKIKNLYENRSRSLSFQNEYYIMRALFNIIQTAMKPPLTPKGLEIQLNHGLINDFN